MGTLVIGDEEYVVIPKAEYARLLGAHRRGGRRIAFGADADVLGTANEVKGDALPFVLDELGKTLRAAREHAGLSQVELAKKLGKAQTTVSQAEAGRIRVSEKYVAKLLKACKLPEDWARPREADAKATVVAETS